MENPLVSVIIPCYNVSLFIEDSILSIINQTYKNLEIIAIDDCSSDNTWELLLNLEKLDSRLKVYRNDENLKLINTLNRAIDLSQGEFIARMDGDDISVLTRIEQEIKMFIENDSIDIVSVFPVMINQNGRFHSIQRHFYCTSTGSAKFKSIFESPILHAAILIKAEILKKNKYIFNDELIHIEDYELWVRLLHDKDLKFIAIPKPLYKYRINQESVSYLHREIQYKNHIELSKKNIERYLGEHIEYKYLKIILLRDFDVNCSSLDFRLAVIKFRNIKNNYLISHKLDLSNLDNKEIKRWTQQRILRICCCFLIKGNFLSKLHSLFFISTEISCLTYSTTYRNLLSRFQWFISNYRK